MNKLVILLCLSLLPGAAFFVSCGKTPTSAVNTTGSTSTATATSTAATTTPTPNVTTVATYTSNSATNLTVDSSNNVYVDLAGAIGEISSTGVVSTVVSAPGAFSSTSYGLAYDGTYFYETYNGYILQCSTSGGAVSISDGPTAQGVAVLPVSPVTVFAGFSAMFPSGGTIKTISIAGWSTTPTKTTLVSGATSFVPYGLSADSSGNLYYETNNYIGESTNAGVTSTIAGNGTSGYLDGAQASAEVGTSYANAVDSQGNVYFADNTNLAIREVTTGGQVKTLVGPAQTGSAPTPLVVQTLVNPRGVAVDNKGNVYFSDKTSSSTGVVYKFQL